MSSLYVRDLMADWMVNTPGLVLPYVDTINREVSPKQGTPWATLSFVSALTQKITYCGHMEERGTFDYIALGQAGIGARDLIAAAEHDLALVMQQADPGGRLTLLQHTPPEDFLQGGSVPWYTVSMIVDYLYEQPLPTP
jgi:hypothetical protein